MKILMFAGAAELAGGDSVEIPLETPVLAAEVKIAIVRKFPDLAMLVAHSRLAVDGEYISDETTIELAEEIALIPPVSGG